MSVRFIRVLPVVLALCGCASAYEKARSQDTAEAYRAFLRENPADPAAPVARGRLAELEFQRARRQHTVLGYKRFLAAFGDTSRASDARLLLEGLRFEAARREGTSSAWLDFLREHPSGAHAQEARHALQEADFKAAMEAPASKSMSDFLARHPSSPHRDEAERALDDRLFAEAREAGPRGLAEYLEKYTAGRHRDEARAQLSARDALARAQIGDFKGARRRAELIPDAAVRAEVELRIDRLELEWTTADLDPRGLLGFALKRDGELAADARRRAQALGGEKGPGKALEQLARRLDPARYARPEDELIRVLRAPDPRDRWIAAEELGRAGAIAAIDPLLDAVATSRFSRVRTRAFEALARIFALLPADTLDLEVRARIESLRQMAQGADLHVKLGVLNELVGNPRGAASDYERALRSKVGDAFALWRLAKVRAQEGEAFSAGVAARELATRVLQLTEQRAQDEGLSPLLLSRTLCGSRDEAREALAVLQGIPGEIARDFTDDHALFVRRADEALRVASARLADAEVKARWNDRSFKGCDDDGQMGARLDEGEADRLAAVQEMAKANDPRLRPALERVASRDPSPQVREAARAAIGVAAKGE
ncbi:MAG: HEAT repeat domain-containing protein [Myxococcales bacterium]|jgi:hypothetical protein